MWARLITWSERKEKKRMREAERWMGGEERRWGMAGAGLVAEMSCGTDRRSANIQFEFQITSGKGKR